MVRVKVCGVTRVADARLAVELGAWGVGFVFWPRSRRSVQPAQARAIADSLPADVLKVGVFVDEALDLVIRTVREAALTHVQLHGAESLDYARALPVPVIKAIPVDGRFTPAALDPLPPEILPLLDAHDPVQHGGTGRTIDWTVAAEAAARRPVVLAGGLHAGNIRAAVAAVAPFAVDLSSGVEQAPGVKDPRKLHAFFEALQA